MNITRGFTGRPRAAREGLPPGQYDAGDDWPVLSAEVTPDLSAADWTFRVGGLVTAPRTWSWEEAHRLPAAAYEGDIHCVTGWSKFGVRFGGVSLDAFLDAAGPLPSATHAVAHAHTGYTANLPLADLTGGRAWIVWSTAAGRSPPSTAARRGWWCRTCTSGRASSGSRAWNSSTTTSRASGSATATTPAATPGRSSGTPVTETTFPSPARFAVPGRIAVSEQVAARWQTATITGIRRETPRAATFRLAVPSGPAICPAST
ncbi:hypothetical protein SFUMM280S_05653 [Streptomyces fumanus]